MSNIEHLHAFTIHPLPEYPDTLAAIHFQCPFTSHCQNNRCFWKQRDCYGLYPWAMSIMNDPDNNIEITKKYGEAYFPKWTSYCGTNTIAITCQDYKGISKNV